MSYALLLLLTAFALAGCEGVPQTEVSLSEPGEAPHDERLIGFWQMNYRTEHGDRDEDGNRKDTNDPIGALHIQIWPREDGLLSVLGVGIGAEAIGFPWLSWVLADAHASEVDGVVYHNLRVRAVDPHFYSVQEYRRLPGIVFAQEQRYFILRVNLSDEEGLFLHFMNPSVLKDLIKEDQISGRRLGCGGEWCYFSVVDASRGELVGLIRELGSERLFMPIGFGPFHRVKADTQSAILDEYMKYWENTQKKTAGEN